MAARERWKMGKNFRHKVKWISGIAQQFPPHFCYGVLVLSAILLIFSWQSTVVALFRCYSIFKPEIQPLETTVDDWQSSGQAAMTTLWLMAFGLAAVVGCGFFFGQKALSQPQPIAESSKLKSACATLLETFVEGFSLSFWDRRLATGLQLVARVIFFSFCNIFGHFYFVKLWSAH